MSAGSALIRKAKVSHLHQHAEDQRLKSWFAPTWRRREVNIHATAALKYDGLR
jgi:hypothetical protein